MFPEALDDQRRYPPYDLPLVWLDVSNSHYFPLLKGCRKSGFISILKAHTVFAGHAYEQPDYCREEPARAEKIRNLLDKRMKTSIRFLDRRSTLIASLSAAIFFGANAVVTTGSEKALSLSEAIDRALEQNLGLSIERRRSELAVEEIQIEKAAFDYDLFLNGALSEQVSAGAGDALEGSANPENDTRDYSLGVRKRLASGAEVTAATYLNRYSDNSTFRILDPDYNARIQLELQQPLLKGFGKKINLAALAQSQSRLVQTELEVRKNMVNLITETEIQYWRLAYVRQHRDLLRSSVEVAQTLLEQTREREHLGLSTKLEVLQARSSLASKRESVILAQQEIEDSNDILRRLIGEFSISDLWLDVSALPEELMPLPDLARSYQSAVDWNLETRIQEEVIKQREINLRLARNSRLPDLDLSLRGGFLGRDEEGDNALNDAVLAAGYNWRAALAVSIPWGFREDKARYRMAKVLLEQEKTRLEDINERTLLEVRIALRNLQAAQELFELSGLTVSLHQEQFEQERIKHKVGASTFRNVLEAQEDLDEARMRRLHAMLDMVDAAAELKALDGSILNRHGFSWESLESRLEG